jgi:hypothetical protein
VLTGMLGEKERRGEVVGIVSVNTFTL